MTGNRPLALFTGGPIGAGKSLLGDHLAPRLGLLVLDLDHLTAEVAALRPQRPHWDNRPTAIRLLHCWQDRLVAALTPVLVQTTASDGGYTLALERRYRAAGYATAMAFVDAPDALCRARNARRPQPRPDGAVAASLSRSRNFVGQYRAAFGHFALIDNSGSRAELLAQADAFLAEVETIA